MLPEPPALGPPKPPPPPDPPETPTPGLPSPPSPPPLEVIVEKTEFDPELLTDPPPPTVIGKAVTVIGNDPALQPGLG